MTEPEKKGVSALLITYNEEKNIRRCLDSIRWVAEIVVVDSESSDRTRDICREYTDRIFVRKFMGFSAQKNFGLSKCNREWVLTIDADEVVSEELKNEICELDLAGEKSATGKIVNDDFVTGFQIPVKTVFFDRWIRYGGWYPNYHLRLFKRDQGRFNTLSVHESIKVKGVVKKLSGAIEHYPYQDLKECIDKADYYSSLAAQEMFKNRKFHEITPLNMIFRPALGFFQRYFLKLGFLDGFPGLILNVFHAYYIFMKYAKIWEMRKRNDPVQEKSK